MAATAAALATQPTAPTSFSLAPLARFRGVKRRQEERVRTAGLTVIEDFGHHPTALAETLKSFRNRFPGQVLTAVFEPRSNTARTNTLQAGFMSALALADEVYLGAVNRAEKLKADERFDTVAVMAHLEACGVRAASAPTNAQLLENLVYATLPASSGKQRLVVFFSNGSFDGIIANYVKQAAVG
jgi:UDP-N-acetylmuramate: L-alanyl-gamma-D-glutamyl-meso-diaminopimelate ligase